MNSIKIVLNLGKMSKGGGGWGVPKISEHFSLTFDHFRILKSSVRKDSVQKLNSFSEANRMKFYAVLSHFAKCRDLRVKVLRDCPK